MRYYKVEKDRQTGKYKVLIYKVLFSIPVQVFVGYAGTVKTVNDMLNFYSKRTHTTLNTYYSLQAGGF